MRADRCWQSRCAVPHVAQDSIGGGDAVDQSRDHRDRHSLCRPFETCRRSPRTIRRRRRQIAVSPGALPGEHPRLDGGIILHRAVAVEMVGRDVGEDAGIGLEARHQIDLKRRQFKHIDAILDRRLQQRTRPCRYCRRSRIAPAALKRWPISAVVVDLPLVPVMATSCAPVPGDFALEDFRVADDLDARRLAPSRRSSAARDASSGTPGLSTSASSCAKSMSRRSTIGKPACRALSTAGSESSQANTSAPPACKRRDAGEARARQAEDARPSCL